ncbi:hypothetical protein J5Y03_12120 [Bacillus sp. RG28]|uniref:Uncharacterized protein n=1 Tax=Gottfriedia endophytica TaxID=2820819 RepID=A0A940NRX8_9BACI|nr:hypothetical protein [Gottfriedia endophytica]MBP0725917.1 hypothetical protein [Gottfriedia endophytica]
MIFISILLLPTVVLLLVVLLKQFELKKKVKKDCGVIEIKDYLERKKKVTAIRKRATHKK